MKEPCLNFTEEVLSRTNFQGDPFFVFLAKRLLAVVEKRIVLNNGSLGIREMAIEAYGLVIKLMAITSAGLDLTKMDSETNEILKETMDEVGQIQFEPLRSAVMMCETSLKQVILAS